MSDHIGQQFGNYRLIRLLGQGGFAQVYLGEHTYLHTQAAIKVLHAELEKRDVELFYREARTIAHLVHPYIVRVLEFGVEGIVPFLVMDYAPNGTLRQSHPRGMPVPPPSIISYVRQVASALQYAHDNRVVHRDVKPENMLVSRQNEILLSDFGIAFVAQTSLHQSIGDMAGTIAYMAPEQLEASPLPASDQYSLAVVVYEWLCGERPFNGTFTEIAVKHRTASPPSLCARMPSLPAELEQVVMTALAKDPGRRFATMTVFATALEQSFRYESAASSSHTGIAYTPPSPLPLSENLRIDLATLPAHSNTPQNFPGEYIPNFRGSSSGTDRISPSATTRVDFVLPQAPSRRMTRRAVVTGAGLAGLGVLATGGGTLFMLLRKLQSQQPEMSKPRIGTTFVTYSGHIYPVYTAAWSTDGRYIASGGSDTTVQIWNAINGDQLFVYRGHAASVGTVAWSPNRQSPHIIASSSADRTIQLWDTSSKKLLLAYRDHVVEIRAMAWSPDGKYIASGDTKGNIHVWNVNDGKLLLTHASNTRLWTLGWSPDGKRIASGGDSGIVEVWSTDNSKVLVTYSGHAKTHFLKAVAWSSDGKWIASGSDDWTVHVWNSVSGETRTIYSGHFEVINAVAWSPDGRYVSSGSGDHIVQVWNPSSGQQVYAYRGHSLALHAVPWSPDSTRIASASDDTYVKVWQAV